MRKKDAGKEPRAAATMLTTAEVARLFNVSPATVRRWTRQGKIRAFRTSPHGALRFRREDIAIAYLDRSIRRYLKNSRPQE
jgi:excisionase family DNA binding protein